MFSEPSLCVQRIYNNNNNNNANINVILGTRRYYVYIIFEIAFNCYTQLLL